MRCAQITILLNMCLSCIESCFTEVSLLVNLNRAGIALISSAGRHLYILCFGLTFLYSISLSVKRINPSAPIRIFLIRALIARQFRWASFGGFNSWQSCIYMWAQLSCWVVSQHHHQRCQYLVSRLICSLKIESSGGGWTHVLQTAHL